MSFQHRSVQGLGAKKRMHPPYLLGRILLVLGLFVLGTQAAQAAPDVVCNNNALLPQQPLTSDLPDLQVTGRCHVLLSMVGGDTYDYYFKNVNILAGGELFFTEAPKNNSSTHFWANSIIIENGGGLYVTGSSDDVNQPFGYRGGVLTIHLYGKNEAELNRDEQNQGALCKSTTGPCGIPKATIWDTNGASQVELPGLDHGKPVPIRDYFYQYGPLHGDGRCTGTEKSVFKDGKCRNSQGNEPPGAQVGYFGNKVLAVSYGGTLDSGWLQRREVRAKS